MTWGHLLFSVTVTAYILFGIYMEERSLLRHLGEDYARYRERTPMLIPLLGGRRGEAPGYGTASAPVEGGTR
jgi:protein-S-isoprenylcysteine O-methyltransferase Ste14